MTTYRAKVARRFAFVKRQWQPDPVLRRHAIVDHAALLDHESQRGFRDVYPTPNSYQGARAARCPRLTPFACMAVATVSYYLDSVRWRAFEAAYVLTGWKCREWLDWEAAEAEAYDERLLSYAY